MDMQIIRDLFANCVSAAEILGVDQAFRKLRSEGLVNPKNLRCAYAIGEEVADDLHIHGWPSADAGVLDVFMLRREGGASEKPFVRGFFDQRVEEKLRRTFHRWI